MVDTAETQIKKCFNCNQPVKGNDFKFEPETFRYYGSECFGKVNKCHECGGTENGKSDKPNFRKDKWLGWYGDRKLCGDCFFKIENSKGGGKKVVKNKAELKKDRKEKAQNEARCLFCAGSLGYDLNDLNKIININHSKEKLRQAFLICVECLTGGDLPDNQDLKAIRQGWDKGGLLLTNIKVFPRAESLLMTMIEDNLKVGNLEVFWEDGKVYMEAKHGGITIELNIYRKTKEEDKKDKSYFK